MVTGLHLLITYRCTKECDHCFVFSSPDSRGTFSLAQIKEVLSEAKKIGSIQWIYFEGGEAFLYYPLLLEGIKLAYGMGFKVGIVSNGYWAMSEEEDIKLWLTPMAEFISDLSISDDSYHAENENDHPSRIVSKIAKSMGIPMTTICLEEPKVEIKEFNHNKGDPIIGGDIRFRGRAVDKLLDNLPLRNWKEMVKCPYEELVNPKRVHLDSFGNVQICQGINIGNMWELPLSEILLNYKSEENPIMGPLIQGGPAELARKMKIAPTDKFVDECHLCYTLRKNLLSHLPQYLGPKQVYGLE